MLTITVPAREWLDEATSQIFSTDETVLELEHSLVSLSKWEAKYERAFLGKQEKTNLELVDYVRMMTLTEGVSSEVYFGLTQENLNDIIAYIESKQSATTFGEEPKKGRGETVTAELIYYWMIAFQIPVKFESWHLNRLLTLIRVCNVKNSKPKKMSPGDLAKQWRETNKQRRAEMGTSG